MRSPIRVVVEVAAGEDGALPLALLAAAYSASRSTRVLLALDVRADVIDRALDPIVRRHGLDVHGVLYADSRDEQVLLIASGADVVVAGSAPFRRRLAERGIVPLGPEEAPAALAALARLTASSGGPAAVPPPAPRPWWGASAAAGRA